MILTCAICRLLEIIALDKRNNFKYVGIATDNVRLMKELQEMKGALMFSEVELDLLKDTLMTQLDIITDLELWKCTFEVPTTPQ